MVRGTDPIVRGTDPIVRDTDPLVRGTDPTVRGADPLVRGIQPEPRGTYPLVRIGTGPLPRVPKLRTAKLARILAKDVGIADIAYREGGRLPRTE